jgi:hypothetical protein
LLWDEHWSPAEPLGPICLGLSRHQQMPTEQTSQISFSRSCLPIPACLRPLCMCLYLCPASLAVHQ